MRLQIMGRVSDAVLRFSRDGVPTLTLHMEDAATKQSVRVRVAWPDASHATQFVASAQRARYRNQAVAVNAINPRFRKARLDCEASSLSGITLLSEQ